MNVRLTFLVVCVSMVAFVATSPIKEKDIDDIIYRLAEIRSELHLDDNKNGSEAKSPHFVVHNADVGEEITDSDRNRLLYDYFVNPIGRFHGKRDFDEIDRWGFDKRNFDEIDRYGFNKRMSRIPFRQAMRAPRVYKRNMDEIDRFGLNDLKR